MLNSDETIQKHEIAHLLPQSITKKSAPSLVRINIGSLISPENICELHQNNFEHKKLKRRSAPGHILKTFQAATCEAVIKKEGGTSATDPILRRSSKHAKHNLSENLEHRLLLDQIYEIAYLKLGNSPETTKIIQFSKDLFENHYCQQLLTLDNEDHISSLLGQLIFLIDRSPELLLQQSNNPNVIQAVFKIEEAFDRSLTLIQDKIAQEERKQLESGLQEEKIAKNTQLPIEISRILTSSTGIINYPLIPKVITTFIKDDAPQRNYSQHIQKGLNTLYQSKELRNKIELTPTPESPNDPGAVVVKMALNLPLEKNLSNAEVIQTILAAFLTHHRQGRSGSCFAAFLTIGLQNFQPDKTIEDLQNLISRGGLSRLTDGEKSIFPYLLKVSQEELSSKLQINELGILLSSHQQKMAASEIPNIVAVCQFLEIKDPQKVLLNWLSTQNLAREGITVTVNQLIEAICAGKTSEEVDLARSVYCSQTSNPLLGCWENAIAGMAEAQKKSMLNDALIQSTLFHVEKYAKKLTSPLENENLLKLKADLESLIHLRGRYLYDPAFHSIDNPKTQGAFVLYDTFNSHNPAQWKRIDNVKSFQQFIISLLDKAFKNVSDDKRSAAIFELNEQFSKTAMMISFLKKYHSDNRVALARNESFTHLNYTPWVSMIGNNPEMVLKVYHGSNKKLETESIKPANPLDLLSMIQDKISYLSTDSKIKNLNTSAPFIPISIQGVHTFSLLNSHPSMKGFSKPKKGAVKWIQENTILPGKETSQISLTPALKDIILQCTYEKLGKQHLIDIIKTKFSATDQRISINEFRNKLLSELFNMLPPTVSYNKIQRELDLKIAQELPIPLKKIWEASIIHFADTNWQYAGRDIHFGVGINPGSGILELLMMQDDGRIYGFLDQNKYFGTHPWELFLNVDSQK